MSKVEKDLRESLNIVENRQRLFEDTTEPDEIETDQYVQEEEGDLICPSCDALLLADNLQFQENEDDGMIISACPECGEVFGLDEDTAVALFGEAEDYDDVNEDVGDPRDNIVGILRQARLEEDIQAEDDEMDEALRWRVKHGVKVRRKRKRRRPRTAKQKMAIKKARRKAWTGKAKRWRAKSLKILKRFAEDEEPYEEDYFDNVEEIDEDELFDILNELDEEEMEEFLGELDEEELGEVQDLYERKRRIRGGRVSYRPTKMASRLFKRRFRMSSALRRALKRARTRIRSASRRKAVRSRRKGYRMGLYRR